MRVGKHDYFPFGAEMSPLGGLGDAALADIQQDERGRQEAARSAFDDFLRDHGIPMREVPEETGEVTARWLSLEGHAPDVVAEQGGAFDLIVLGRPLDG